MAGAESEPGNLRSVAVADKVAEAEVPGVKEVVKAGAPGAGPLKAEVVSKPEDEVGKQGVEEEEDDEGPLEDRVDEDEGDLVGVPVQHRRELVRRHSRSLLACYAHRDAADEDRGNGG